MRLFKSRDSVGFYLRESGSYFSNKVWILVSVSNSVSSWLCSGDCGCLHRSTYLALSD